MPPDHLYILGTRGIPAAHGGFETFAQDLAVYLTEQSVNVTVYCHSDKNSNEIWQGIRCVHIKSSQTTWGTMWFDLRAILHALKQPHGTWLTLGYNTGLLNFIPKFFGKKQIINMDGIEWRRGKWSLFYKIMFYLNYWCAGLAGNILIADNPAIAALLQKNFKSDKIKMIPYGADPMNAYHRNIIHSASPDVIFLGAIYDKTLVDSLRFYAAVYVHGHQVGGTNPSLVEALAAGNAVIADDNPFNRWTAGDAARYFASHDELEKLLDKDDFSELKINARKRFHQDFERIHVLDQYRRILFE